MRKKLILPLVVAAAVAATGLTALAQVGQGAASAEAVKVATRRITESQYRHTIRDVFGPEVVIDARFEPENREEGLFAIGSRQLSVTSSGFEQYFSLARTISNQLTDPKLRDKMIPCKPADPKAADDACARQVVAGVGERLFRRPLTAAEVDTRVAVARNGAAQQEDFYKGLAMALNSLLVAPEFLFRVEVAEPDPVRSGQYRLDAYTKASRLSHLFWDTAPDAELLAAAKSGAIHDQAELNRQIARLSASPKLEDGARAFFSDMLQFDRFDSVTKDASAYPKFSQTVADAAREQTLKTLVDLLVTKKGDYRDLFTSNQTYINRHLAAVYNVPYASAAEWAPYTFAEDSQRSGILTQVTFLSLFSHPAASSPTIRGMKMHEIFMCEPMPEPPPDVDFSKVQALDKGTVRTRLTAHMENEGCASCHQLTDPPGLALERFDGIGQLRMKENGAVIDVRSKIEGKTVEGAPGLGRLLRADRRIPQCLVRNVYAYGVGRPTGEDDQAYLDRQTRSFASDGYRYVDLLANVAASPEFLKPAIPEGARASVSAAVAQAPQGAVR